MDLPKRFARRGIVLYLQIAAAIVSLILGIASITKESAPLVERMRESQQQMALQAQAEALQRRALEISQMGIQWQYRGNDGAWRYYSDGTGRYWFRTNIEGVQEYSENPHVRIQVASNPSTIR